MSIRSVVRRRWPWGALGAVAVAGLVLIGVAVSGMPPAPPTPPTAPVEAAGPPATATSPAESGATPGSAGPTAGTPGPSGSSSAPASADAPVPLGQSEPTAVTIRAIGVDSTTVDLGLDTRGEMETPQDPDEVGWFTGAVTPGSPGVAVLAGHVTWNGRPTVFFRLGELRTGDEIDIRRADGIVVTYRMDRRSTFPKDEFPTNEVYRAADRPELVLITCGGNYDRRAGYYDANVIVWASMVGQHR